MGSGVNGHLARDYALLNVTGESKHSLIRLRKFRL